MKKKLTFNAEQIHRTFDIYQNRIHEVRVLPHSNVKYSISGYFDSADALIAEIKRLDIGAVPFYMTLNEINTEAECIATINHFQNGNRAAADKDIIRYSKIHIDYDPSKPAAHCQATEEEVKYAEEKLHQVYEILRGEGFPEGVKAFSGNGFNLDFYTNLPNTPENKALIKQFLKCLSDNWSDEKVKVDTTTFNPARIIKYFGCVAPTL